MSQMVTRKRTGGDEKEKDPQRQTDSPVKDMKKKMAANAEKEKNAVDKPAEKLSDKPADKTEKPKAAEKAPERPAEKKAEKPAERKSDAQSEKKEKPTERKSDAQSEKKEKPTERKSDAQSDKKDKPAERKSDAQSEKKDKPAERKSDAQSEKKKEDSKGESSGKTDKPDKRHDTRRPAQNGGSVNGTVSGGAVDSDSDELVIDENDEMFPELAYDDSDVEWEPGMDAPSRSLTRRSQVKVARTPETPRPASDKLPEDESKDSKILKLNQESGKTDSPKPDKKPEKTDAKKPETRADTKHESPKKAQGDKEASKSETKKDAKESKDEGKVDKSDKVEVEVVVEIESTTEPSEESRKPDTNYSKSRVKVSPYRRSMRLADQTTSSIAANYTGNNTTMEMDITESSSLMEESLDDSSYLSGLRSIRGRRSYKPLKEMTLRSVSANRSVRSAASVTVPEVSRPTGTVVGRKRKPDADDIVSLCEEADELPAATSSKRQRLLDRLARPFRRTLVMPARRNAEIVGINTDLPLSAPVASADTFDPESLKPSDPPAPLAPLAHPAPLAPGPAPEDSKRCVIM